MRDCIGCICEAHAPRFNPAEAAVYSAMILVSVAIEGNDVTDAPNGFCARHLKTWNQHFAKRTYPGVVS